MNNHPGSLLRAAADLESAYLDALLAEHADRYRAPLILGDEVDLGPIATPSGFDADDLAPPEWPHMWEEY